MKTTFKTHHPALSRRIPKRFSNINRLIPFVVLLLLGLLPLSGRAADKILTIGILSDGYQGREDPLYEALKKEVSDLLGIEYDEIRFDPYLPSNYDVRESEQHFQALLDNEEVDVVMGIGLIASDILASGGPYDKPVIASVVIDPQLQHLPLTKNFTSGVENLTYMLSPYAPLRDMEIFHGIVPFRHIAIFMDHYIQENIPALDAYFDAILEQLGAEYTLIEVNQRADAALEQITEEMDAVYFGALFSMRDSTELRKLIGGVADRKLPSFGLLSIEEYYQGAMGSVAPPSNLDRLARRLAVNLRKILDDKEAGEIDVRINYREDFVLDMEVARQIGFSPAWPVLLEARLLHEDPQNIGRKLNLLGVIEEGIKNNKGIAVAEAEVAAGAKDIPIARANLLPRLEMSTGMRMIDADRAASSFGSMPERVATGSATLTQVLFSEPARGNVDIQRWQQKARESEREKTEMDITLEVAQAYLQVLRAKTFAGVQRDNLSLTRKNLELARVRTQVGYSGPSDFYRWESEIASAKSDLQNAQANLRIAEMNLNQLLNRPIDEQFETEEVGIEDEYLITNDPRIYQYLANPAVFKKFSAFMVEEGKRQLPELAQLDAFIGAQQRSLLLAQRNFYLPTVSFQASADYLLYKGGEGTDPETSFPPIPNFSFSGPNNFLWQIGVQASLPIFTGFDRKAKVEKADLQLIQLNHQRRDAVNKLEQRLRSDLATARVAYTDIDLTQDSREAALKNLELVQDAYAKGVVSIIQLIDAQNAALQSDLAAANAFYEFVIELLKVERSVGSFYTLASPESRDAYFQRLDAFVNGN